MLTKYMLTKSISTGAQATPAHAKLDLTETPAAKVHTVDSNVSESCYHLLLGKQSSHEVCLFIFIISHILLGSFTYLICSNHLKSVASAHM